MRRLDARLEVTGVLRCETAVHVGGTHHDAVTDLTLATDGRGRLYVPGTSLAGALRAWSAQRFPEQAFRDLWGYVDERKKDSGQASALWIDDAPVTLADGAVVEIRDGVGIDRHTGAAAAQIKYDRAVLPRGTTIDIRVVLEAPEAVSNKAQEAEKTAPPSAESLLGAVVAALARGDIAVGAGTTRGLGRVRLEEHEVRRRSLADRDGVLRALRGGDLLRTVDADGSENVALPPAALPEPPSLVVDVAWEPAGPLMVRSSTQGELADAVPLMTDDGAGGLTMVLPGASVKGVLRSHAERIMRTVLGVDVPSEAFLQQLEQKELRLVHWLFGTTPSREGDDAATSDPRAPAPRVGTSPRPGRGAVRVHDCYAKPLRPKGLNHDAWQAVTEGPPNRKPDDKDPRHLRTTLREAGLDEWTGAHHVAIDRWTGGAADSRLFTVLEPHGVAWEPLHLHVDLARIPDDDLYAAVALLVLVLRDLEAGRLAFGYATNRGLGAVRVTGISLEAHNVPPRSPLRGAHTLDEVLVDPLRADWQNHLDRWQTEQVGRGEDTTP